MVAQNIENGGKERASFRLPRDPDGQMFLRLLLMRKQEKKFPDSEALVNLYEKTGNPVYYNTMVHMILDAVVLRRRLTDLIPRHKN